MALKEFTAENHKRAEQSWFAQTLLSGSIDPHLYYAYLCNQYHIYFGLEPKIPLKMLGLTDISRVVGIDEDLAELEKKHGFTRITIPTFNSTIEYQRYLYELQQNNPRGLLAHLYVRHFGDMYGGAIVAKKVPSSGEMYKFENKEILKDRVRNLLEDDMADEANRCFEFAIRLFEELGDWYESKQAGTGN